MPKTVCFTEKLSEAEQEADKPDAVWLDEDKFWNEEYTAELHRRIKRLDEGKGIVKTMAELRAMENI